MNRWDQEMLRGQIAPEQLGYPGLMPDRQFSYGGNDISLGDIRPEDNLLMRAYTPTATGQGIPSLDDMSADIMRSLRGYFGNEPFDSMNRGFSEGVGQGFG